MRILAIETSTRSASIALMEDARVLDIRILDAGNKTTSQITPAIRDSLISVGWRPEEVNLVAVSQGPGSFTGLRVGATTAKTFAYAVKCQLVGIDSLHVLAAQAASELAEGVEIEAISDAGRNQLYAARFTVKADRLLEQTIPTAILDVPLWMERLTTGCTVVGPILKRLASQVPDFIEIAPQDDWLPRAETLGRLGLDALAVTGSDDPWKFKPKYFRRSAAEEKLDAHRKEG